MDVDCYQLGDTGGKEVGWLKKKVLQKKQLKINALS